jgi:all-trans-retinol 13,14-reductase
MKTYDDIVVGAGISGLTLAALLAGNGRKVLLLEKAPYIGGSMCRFLRAGVPFDTGFHFSGGLGKQGLLTDMLKVLDLNHAIEPFYLDQEKANNFIFEDEGAQFYMPLGVDATIDKLKKYFPNQVSGIDKYFSLIDQVCKKTFPMDLRKIASTPDIIDEDYISLQTVLDQLFTEPLLKGIFSVYCSCHGTKPSQISFANHARVVLNMYESVGRVKNGGQAFIDGFKQKLSNLGVDILCNSHIAECSDVEKDMVGTFILNDGTSLKAQCCTFTIHPQELLKILPRKFLSKAFVDRVSEFESSAGFFSLFGVLEGSPALEEVTPSITSLFPCADVNSLFEPTYSGQPALVVMTSHEEFNNRTHRVLNAFALSFYEHVAQWKDSKLGNRSAEYINYKKDMTDKIYKRIVNRFPYYKASLKVLDSASMLTFRDYLNSPDGAAYGIKQKIGQINLFGKLPLRNVYSCGQSSVLPGIVGAMMSSFVIARALVGRDDYSRFIEDRLCKTGA